MRAAIYLRVSTDEQAEHGHGIDFQREECRRKAAELGARSVDEYADEGVSGAVLARPALLRLLAAVQEGRYDVVLCWDASRLSRELRDQLDLRTRIRQRARLLFVQGGWDEATPEGELMFNVSGSVAQYERAKVRERTMAGRRQKARSGKLPFGFAPYGYRYDREHSTLVPVEEEARVVRRIFDDLVRYRAGLNGIARALTLEGVPTRSGAPWHRQVVRQIASNPVYKGVYYANRRDMSGVALNPYRPRGEKRWGRLRPPEEWIPVPVPAIVPEAVWERAQAVLAQAARLWRGGKHTYLLRGLVRCGHCGLPMAGSPRSSWGRVRRAYTCRRHQAGAGPRGCGRAVWAEELEEAVWRWLLDRLADPPALARELARLLGESDPGAARAEAEALRRELGQVERRGQAVLALVERGLADAETAAAPLERLRARAEALRARLAQLEAALAREEAAAPPPEALEAAAAGRLALLLAGERPPLPLRQQLVRGRRGPGARRPWPGGEDLDPPVAEGHARRRWPRRAMYGGEEAEEQGRLRRSPCGRRRREEAPERGGRPPPLIDVLEDGSEPVADVIANRWSASRVKALLEALGPRERQVLELRYGAGGGERLTQREVARRLGISRSYVSRLEKRAVRLVQQAWKAMQHGDPRTARRPRPGGAGGRDGHAG
ncbi:MAG: sigma-70 family RNA polymerase sigma factor [Bacillota bacterium]|nr:sigma-70 family RNA polymerase sigma factor [Bacillota bacterium]